MTSKDIEKAKTQEANPVDTLKKRMGHFSYKIIGIKDLKNQDYISIELSINDSLKELIEGFMIVQTEKGKERVKQSYDFYSFSRSRYLIPSRIINSLYGITRLILADTELVDNGKVTLFFSSYDQFENFQREIRDNLQRLIHLATNYSNINTTINFNIS